MFTIPVINVKTNPLDALLAGLGLRIQMLAKAKNNEAFNNLIKDRNVTLQFLAPDMARYYRFNQGIFGQELGLADTADLTIEFDNALTGAKLLAKADMAALMTAIQDGEVKITGDYKLVLWFAGIGKQAATVPEEYQGYVKQAKTYAELAKPYVNTAKEILGELADKLSSNKTPKQ